MKCRQSVSIKLYVPADYEMHIWEATRALTDAGIIVIMAAGNGGGSRFTCL